MTKFEQKFGAVLSQMTNRYIITADQSGKKIQFVIGATLENVNERAATFANYRSATVLNIQEI